MANAQYMATLLSISITEQWNQLYIKLNPRDKVCMSD